MVIALTTMGAGCNTAAPTGATAPSTINGSDSTAADNTVTDVTGDSAQTSNQTQAPDQATDQTQTSAAAPADNVKEFTMTAQNWQFSPATITVNKGDKVRLKITSVDVTHGFALKDFNVNVTLEPGQTQIVEFVADKVGSFSFRCSVPCGEGHREMQGTLIVK